tara:strand:+ start:523 stop:1134 length:612 start_codon:yes stop_codon:yes gene_type:complete
MTIKEKNKIKFFTFLILSLIIISFITSIAIKSYEFIYYNVLILILVLLTYFLHQKIRMHLLVFVSTCIVMVMHAAGGILHFGGIRLYDIFFGFIRYDHIVHFVGIFVIIFVIYNLIYPYLKPHSKKYNPYLFLILIFMAMGFGALIEISELIAVIFFDASKGVGGYMNNAIDLVVNMLGAIAGATIILLYRRTKKFKELIKPK